MPHFLQALVTSQHVVMCVVSYSIELRRWGFTIVLRIKRTVLCASALIIYSSYRAKKLVQRIVFRLYSCIQGPATCNRSSVTRWMIVRLCAENPRSVFLSFRILHTKHMKRRPLAHIMMWSLFGPKSFCFIGNSLKSTVRETNDEKVAQV